MSVIAVVLYTKQPFIGWLCIGQYIAGRSAVHKTLFQKKSDKAAFRYIKLFGQTIDDENLASHNDPLGSWTGVPDQADEMPTQDQDDL